MDTRNLIRAVIFDLYDTLVAGGGRDERDTVSHAMAGDLGVDPRAFAEAIRSSFDVRARGLLSDLETTVRALALGLGAEPGTQAVRRAAERWLELHRSLLTPAPAVLADLDRLRADGYRIGLISDCSDETPRLWPHTTLAARIDAAVFSCVARARKPDPALYRMAAAELGVDPQHCVYIGDGATHELGGAAAVGMAAIQLRHATMTRTYQADRASVYGATPWHGPAIDELGQLREILETCGRTALRAEKVPAFPAAICGIEERYTDPLWEVTVSLSDLERGLLRSPPLRRLHFIAHAGASSITTTQTYSRLEHSLGVFVLAAHFHPEHELLRVAALLHDVGHLPFSHTLEELAALNHHALGDKLINERPLAELLTAHGVKPSTITDLLAGNGPIPWNPPPGVLGLDHLDSYVRSARFGARLPIRPQDLLARLDLVDGAVSTDRETAQTLIGLVCGEALLHTSWENIAPSAALHRLVRTSLEAGHIEPAQLARMTDAQLWAALETDPRTRADAEDLRLAPHGIHTVIAQNEPAAASAPEFSLRKIYSSAPLINGQPVQSAAPDLADRLADLSRFPTRYFVKWPESAIERATRSAGAPVPGIAAAFLDCAAAVAPLLHSPRLAERWTEPSALPEFSINALAGHLARAVFNVERFLDAQPVTGEPLDAVTYYLTTSDPAPDPHDPVQHHIRQRGEQAAGTGATDLAARFDAARERLARVLPTLDENQLVTVFDQHTLPLGQALLTRLVELAVHADDLAVSLALPTPTLPDGAADYALDTLTRIARGRHGTAHVIRALARRARAPRSISAF